MSILNVDAPLPEFSVTDENGTIVNNETLKGKKTILFFYPKDNTPGCTNAACSIRDHYSTLTNAGYTIYGVSPDSERKHQNFIAKFDFPFPLLADTEKKMLTDFGLFGPKQFMGKEVIGVYRTTIVVDEEGTITHIIDKVKTKIHAEQIIEVLGLK